MNISLEIKFGLAFTLLFIFIVFLSVPGGSAIMAPTGSLSTPAPIVVNQNTTYSLADVAKHNNQNDCWLIINNNVYNATGYINVHPGGAQMIISACGADATSLFESINRHQSSRAQTDLSSLLIGSIK